ncbi:hypothetical protein ACXHXG_08070 [Rhizobium sp. LEGMi198b]|uniref:hypothetical protein n=1 Tax=unclassified Rhizobium TaxID=2613769 RepID=UPI000CF2CFC4|nr:MULTISPECIES: hypothetical protein [Rhizobium]MDK4737877.1 hypothetical protein [Rhizobium sp. CNPSo 3464]UWU22997.1 hypothetical protein N2601_08645 [Rhizobium tropici]WFU03782.1 hypothetical protein QA648_08605 [Rhizobium sp. CB3171]
MPKLNAGFTGTPVEQPEGVKRAVKSATSMAKREAQAVAIGAQEHQTTTATIVAIGAIIFGLGYLMGRNAAESERSHHWW